MKKSRLIEVLRSFSERELRQFNKYLASPYLNTQADVTRLYEHITLALRQNKDGALDKKQAYQALFPKQTYKDTEIRLLMSALLKQAERFLSMEKYRADQATAETYLAQAYRERKLTKSFRHTLKNARTRQQKKPKHDAHTQYLTSLQYAEEYLFSLQENRQVERDLQAWHDTLNHFFIAETLRQTCILLTHGRVAEKQYDFLLLTDILKQIENRADLLEIPAIQVYYHIYHTLIDGQNETHFRRLKTGIIEYGAGFPQAELREIYTHAINHCVRQRNKTKDVGFLHKLFDLYQVGLKQDAFLENGFLSRWRYKNIVSAGLMLEEFEWVENFIYEYESRLERKYRKDSLTYNLAFLYHATKQYDKAISQLNQVKFNDVFFNLNARNLLLKIYLELREYEVLEAHLNSFEVFIRRKNIANPRRNDYLNIIKLSRKITQLNPHDKSAKVALKKEVEAEKNPSTRAFLLEILK